jgi:hypothetical protein
MPNNRFNLINCPVMIPAGILPQESRQGSLQVKRMLGGRRVRGAKRHLEIK